MTITTRHSGNVELPQSRQSSLRLAIVSEWTKLRSVRSTVLSLIATSGFTIGLGILFTWAFLHRDLQDAADAFRFDPTSHSLRGIFLAQLAIGVLGVVAFVVSVTSCFIAFFVGQAVLSSQHLGVSIHDPEVLRAVLGAGAYLTMIALLGLAIGTIVRRTPGAISVFVGIVLILPLLTEALPKPWNVNIGRLLPFNAGQAMFNVRVDPDLLTPAKGAFIFLAWIAAAFITATAMISTRDV